MGPGESLGAGLRTAYERAVRTSKPLPVGLGRRLSPSAGGARLDLVLGVRHDQFVVRLADIVQRHQPAHRAEQAGLHERERQPVLANSDSMSPILYPLESKSSRPSKLSMLRVLNEGPSEDGVRRSNIAMAVCEAVSHLRGPGRVPSLPPYPWRSIPNVGAARYRHGSFSRTLVPPQARDVTSTSANPRMRLKPMPRPLEHASAPRPTPSSTTSIVRRPSVTRASTSIQPCESPG